MENDLYNKNRADIDRDGTFGELKNFQNATDGTFCEELKSNRVNRPLISNVLYKKPMTKDETQTIEALNIEQKHESDGGGNIASGGGMRSTYLANFLAGGGSTKDYVRKHRNAIPSGYKNTYNSRSIASVPVVNPINSSGTDTKMIQTSIDFNQNGASSVIPENLEQTIAPYANQLANAEFSEQYLKDLKAVEDVDKVMGGEDLKDLRSPASDYDADFEKQMKEIEKRTKEIEVKQKELANRSKKLDQLSQKQKLDAITEERQSLEKELESLKKKEKRIISENKVKSRKAVAKAKSRDRKNESNDKDFQNVSQGNTLFGRSKQSKQFLSNNPGIKDKLTRGLNSINRNPEFNFKVQTPPSGLELQKIISSASEEDFNVKYDKEGRPWLVQVAGETQFFDLRVMTKEEREVIYKKLNFDQGDISGKAVRDQVKLVKNSIDTNIAKKFKQDPSIDKDSMRLKGLNAVLQAAIKDNNKQLVSVLINEIK
jgi:hypothetical protein